MLGDILGDITINNQATVSSHGLILLTGVLGEAPLLGDDDLLAAGELHFSSTESLEDGGGAGISGTDRDDGVTNVDTSDETIGLTEGVSHTSLKTIGTGTGKHLVDTENVPRVSTDSHVEVGVTGVLGQVLVAGNTGGFQSFRGKLLLLIGKHVSDEGEGINGGALATNIVDTNLGIRDTTAETRLDVRLVLTVTIATSRTTTHLIWK